MISHSSPSLTKRNSVAKEENHMKHMMKKNNEEKTKRMDDHNHMTKHMMKKGDVRKVEKKKKRKATKVPLLMGLGLPVLRKRFLNSFQVSGITIIMILRMTMPTMTMMSMIRTSGRTMPAGELTRGRMICPQKQRLNIWILRLSLERRTLRLSLERRTLRHQ